MALWDHNTDHCTRCCVKGECSCTECCQSNGCECPNG